MKRLRILIEVVNALLTQVDVRVRVRVDPRVRSCADALSARVEDSYAKAITGIE